MINLINNLINRIRNRSRNEQGMTLVEVVVAFFIIAIISTVLVRGTITAVNTLRNNRSKTGALAVANEKMEILKSLDYGDVLLTEEDEGWTDSYADLSDDVFTVDYEVSWDNDEENGAKLIKVSVSGDELRVPIEVVTKFFPAAGEEATVGNIFPPPDNLEIQSDEGEGVNREVELVWIEPDTEKTILRYHVYRDDIQIGLALIGYFKDEPGDDNIYTYHVTAYYEDGMESVPSNSVSTGTPFPYPEPQNFIITEYTLGGPNRTVHLAWEAPETELILVGYIIYRDFIEVGSTTPDILTFSNIIGQTNYTFYVTALYEEDNESGPSNMQTTE
jgi:type II secretory pathway pseudopilin PulG